MRKNKEGKVCNPRDQHAVWYFVKVCVAGAYPHGSWCWSRPGEGCYHLRPAWDSLATTTVRRRFAGGLGEQARELLLDSVGWHLRCTREQRSMRAVLLFDTACRYG